jgi:hypothetical protein
MAGGEGLEQGPFMDGFRQPASRFEVRLDKMPAERGVGHGQGKALGGCLPGGLEETGSRGGGISSSRRKQRDEFADAGLVHSAEKVTRRDADDQDGMDEGTRSLLA